MDFTRYMTENFAAFEYKTQEELLTVIKSLTSVLSTSGMQLVEILSPSHLLTQLHGPTHQTPSIPPSQNVRSDAPMDVDSGPPQMPLQPAPEASAPPQQGAAPPSDTHDFGMLRSSIIVAMIMLLKSHLKTMYGISEEYVLTSSLDCPFLPSLYGVGNAQSLSSERRARWETAPRRGSMSVRSAGTRSHSPPRRW